MKFTVSKSDGPKMWSPSWTTTIRGPLFETVLLPAARTCVRLVRHQP